MAKWVEYTIIPAFSAVFLLIAVSEIPPYILQPVRLILLIAVVTEVYYQIKIVQNLILSVLFSVIYWIISMLVLSIAGIFLISRSGDYGRLSETISTIIFLCLMLLIRFWFGNRESGLKTADWTKFGYIPVFSMIVIMALSMTFWDQTTAGGNIRLAAIAGFAVLNICMFYMIGNILEKDRQMQRLTLLQERTQNQMEMYQSMQKNYEQQKKYLHDYKNQLNCIQGMISAGKYEETLEYISGLTGSLRKNADYVNTNHAVVNVILNQKYQEALDHGITMVMNVNDLSTLSMNEEEIVTLLVNLLDNAIEACGKLESNKVIQFKMILEDGGLILAIRNPVDRPVQIRNNKVRTSKPDPANHGIGLLNVEAVIQKNHGTKVLKCEDGWFCFSAMFSQ